MKTIYILLTKTGTWISRMIGAVTEDDFTHVSIAFDKRLMPLYSFSRKYVHLPLPAGPRREWLHEGIMEKFEDRPCALYKIDVSDEVYERAINEVKKMFQSKEKYKYSVLGLIMCGFDIPVHRSYRRFCSQFVAEVLTKSKAMSLQKDTALVHPDDYANFRELTCVFKGSIGELNSSGMRRKGMM